MLPYINAPFRYLSGKLGASPDELKLVFSFFLSYPLAGLLKRIPDANPAKRNLFSIGVSTFYLVGLFDLWDGVRTLLISSAGAYAIAMYLKKSPFMPWIAFVFLMGHLSVNQLARQFANDPAVVDITGAQMVLVMKLSAFCWNVADGQLPESDLSDFQKDRMLKELPSLLDYAGYVMFFPSMLVGPAFDFAEYRRWLDLTMFDPPVDGDPRKRAPTRKKRRIPRSGMPAALKAVSGLTWILLFLVMSRFFPADAIMGARFASHSFLARIVILHMVGLTTRLKYYGVWTLTEGACILSGLGYNGVNPVTGRVAWNRLQNVDPWGVETAQNTRAYLASWNMNTNNWLRNYVYLRVTPRGRKPGFRASLATFTTSAFWHGFYPGYYLTFILASFVQQVAKNFRRYCRPFFLDPRTGKPTPQKRYYDAMSYVVTQMVFSFTTAPFILLSLSASLRCWAQLYFYIIIGTAISTAFFASPYRRILQTRLAERQPAQAPSSPRDAKGAAAAPMARATSSDSINGGAPVLGLSDDPQADIDEAVRELKDFRSQVEARLAESRHAKQRHHAKSG